MKPTSVLMNEHRVIEQVLACVERMLAREQASQAFDWQAAKNAVEFFRHFADHCHHHKEEGCLFPMLEAKGFSREQGPTGVMLREHTQGRELVQGMQVACDQAGNEPEQAFKLFERNAREYVQLLKEHIRKEDHCLFPMAEAALTEEEQEKLNQAFDQVESEHEPGMHERLLNIANQLAEQYDVPVTKEHCTSCSPGTCG